MNNKMILAGDVGGTKTHLGIFKQENGKVVSLIDEKYKSQNFDSFEDLVREFLKFLNQASLKKRGEVLSGRGLVKIYQFLRERGEDGEESADLKKRGKQDKAPLISKAALANENSLCIKALDVFVSIYGAQARNLALQCLPVNGLYIAGGIAPKIVDKLRDTTFMQAFANKNGDFYKLLASIPVRVIMNPKVGLLGAAWRCAKM
jgi:glucokinase